MGISRVLALLLSCTALGAQTASFGGVAVNSAKIDLEGALSPFPSPRLGPDFFRFNGDGWSVGYNLGLLWQPHETVSIGATFRSAAPVTFEGDTEFQSPPLRPVQRSAQMDLKFPLSAVVGLSYRPTTKWNLEFDADYTDWSSFGKTTIHQSGSDSQQGVVPLDIDETLGWQASWMYELGVTHYFDQGWRISAGYVYSETSVPDAYYSPLAADLNRHFFSVGTGHKGKHLDFDVTYQFGYGPAHTVSGSTPSTIAGVIGGQSADGTYDFISHAVFVTVGLRFCPHTPALIQLKRGWRRGSVGLFCRLEMPWNLPPPILAPKCSCPRGWRRRTAA